MITGRLQGCFSLSFQFNKPLIVEYAIDHSCFILNSVPIINLFEKNTIPFELTDHQSNYLLLAHSEHHLFHVNSVFSPAAATKNNHQQKAIDYRPISHFLTNRFDHDDQLFYQIMLKANVRGQPQNCLTLIDSQGKKVTNFLHSAFFADALCTDGDHAASLEVGDICMSTLDISTGIPFSNITKPTREISPIIDSHQHWPIISLLSLSPLFLKSKDAIIQLMTDLYYHKNSYIPQAKQQQQRLQGIVSISSNTIDWILNRQLFRGIEMQIALDPNYFSDIGDMYRFGSVLSQVLPYCMTKNNFLKVNLTNSESNEVWLLDPIYGSR